MDENKASTHPSSGNKTDFLASNSTAGDGRCLTNVLMVTTTVGMVDGVHRHTTGSGPATKIRLD
jgi:hypothetical protein